MYDKFPFKAIKDYYYNSLTVQLSRFIFDIYVICLKSNKIPKLFSDGCLTVNIKISKLETLINLQHSHGHMAEDDLL